MQLEKMLNDIVRKSFDIFKKDYVTLIVATLVSSLMMIFVVTIPPMIFGLYIVCIQLINKKKTKIGDVFKGFNYFLRSWGMILFLGLIIMIGFAALIIPGIILLFLFQYVIAVSLLENKGVFDSLKKSYVLVRENLTFSLVFWLMIAVINAIGSVTRIGFLITLPFTTLCICLAVINLSKKKK